MGAFLEFFPGIILPHFIPILKWILDIRLRQRRTVTVWQNLALPRSIGVPRRCPGYTTVYKKSRKALGSMVDLSPTLCGDHNDTDPQIRSIFSCFLGLSPT